MSLTSDKKFDALLEEYKIVQAEKQEFMRQLFNIGALVLLGTGTLVSVSAQSKQALLFLVVIPFQLATMALMIYLLAQILQHSKTLIKFEGKINDAMDSDNAVGNADTPARVLHKYKLSYETDLEHKFEFKRLTDARRFPKAHHNAALYGFLIVLIMIFAMEEGIAAGVIVASEPSIDRFSETHLSVFWYLFDNNIINACIYFSVTLFLFAFIMWVYRSKVRAIFS